MTNKQILVLNKLVEIAQGVAGVAFAGLYPDAISSVGQRFPAVIVKDGNEIEATYQTGRACDYTYQPELYIHHEITSFITRIADILALQNAILTAIIGDLSLVGLVDVLVGHEVIKGDSQNSLINTESGYQGEMTVHIIRLNMIINDTRS